jgi:predicted pyridoxine 5'-phosphate oxidase superfamily flavin-nucleotide-binding protein
MSWESPFHEGELEAQKLAGEQEQGESNGAMIGDKIMSGAVTFIRTQKMAVISSRDAQGRRWASLVLGKEGFLEPSSDRRALAISIDPAENDATDPLWENLKADAHIGVLIIDLATRRRLRVNGTAVFANNTLTITVEESFGNCPKYITRREVNIEPRKQSTKEERVLHGEKLGKSQTSFLAASDVLFLATGHPQLGADASHRGGNPGFVEVLNTTTLRIPDYSGNSLFNTLGNLLVDPHYGLLIANFQSGRVLQLTGTAKITWSGKDTEQGTGGTDRFVEYHVDEWRETTLPADFSEHFLDYSPYNP